MNEDLLVLLRGRCLSAATRETPELVGWLRDNWPLLKDCGEHDEPRVLRQLVVEAVEAYLEPDYLISVVKIMIGHSVADPARTTRQRILGEMAAAMPRERHENGPAYSTRRIEQLEREVICPAVEAALRLFLGKSVRPGMHPWFDYDLTVSLRPHAKSELVTMRTSMEFTARMRETLIAVTTDESLADGLCQELPDLTEVFVPSEDAAVETIAVQVRDTAHWRALSLSKLSREARQEIVRDTALDGSQVDFYASERRSNNRSARWRIVSDQEVLVADRYCYWSAARTLFLRTVVFDYSAFPGGARFAFEVKPRLGRKIHIRHDDALLLFEIEVGAWVSAGNAVELTWQEVVDR